MSVAVQRGAMEVEGQGWMARVLSRPPLIAPARQFTFPFLVQGEEDALARGALWLEVRTDASDAQPAGAWLGQFALGFAGADVAHGLWELPEGGLLVCAGGYAYAVAVLTPERTALLPPRPAVSVITLPHRTVLVGHHALTVREADAEVWTTPRLSWEGVTVIAADAATVAGTGWDMMDDAEVPFLVDLEDRKATGGGYRRDGSTGSSVTR